MDKELRVKIVAEGTESFKRDMKQTGDSVKDMSNASKNSTQALNILKESMQEQKAKIQELKSEYMDLILRQKEESTEAVKLAQKIKNLNNELLKNQDALKNAENKTNALTMPEAGENAEPVDKNSDSKVDNTTDSIRELFDAMQDIKDLNFTQTVFAGLIAAKEQVEAVKKQIQDMKEEFSMAGEVIKESLSKEGWQECKAAGMSTAKNLKDSFKSVGVAIKASMVAAAKSIGAVIALLKVLMSNTLIKIIVIIAAIVGAVKVLTATIKGAIAAAEKVKTAFFEAQKIGLSTAEYQRWGYVLQSVGVEADVLSDFIKTLSDEQATLREGSEGISKALEQLGMSVKDVVNMTQEELFTETVTRLQQVENQVDRTALAYQIFGEDAAQLANVINMSNGSVQSLVRNYQLLGGEASSTLVDRSLQLSQAVSNLKVAWAGLGNTLAQFIMPVITAVVRWITVAIAKINMFVRAILGYDIASSGSSSATAKATGGMKSYSNAVGGAAKAIEKLKRVTMGFDELNVIPDTSSSDSSGGAGSAGGIGDIGGAMGGFDGGSILNEKDIESLENFRKRMEEIKGTLQGFVPIALTAIGIVGCLACLLFGNWVGAIAFGAMAGLGISIGAENGTWAIMADGIKKIWGDITDWFNTYVAPVFTKEFWIELWENVKTACSEKLEDIKKTIDEKVQIITEWWDKNIAPIFTKEYWLNLWERIKEGAQEKLEEIKKSIEEKVNKVREWWNTNVAPKFTKQYWKDVFDKVKQGIREKIEEIKNTISEKWSMIKAWWQLNVAPKFTKEYWKNVFNRIKEAAASKMDEIKYIFTQKWNNIKVWFSTNIAPKFTKDYWVKKFGGIKDGAKNAFNGVIDAVERAINSIVGKINGLSWEVPSWVPAIGGQRWGFNFGQVHIPRLAEGGITNGSTIANIGEGGYREAVLPLERNTEWMDTLADKIAARQTATPTILNIDGKTFAQTSIDAINNLTKQTGSLKLILA